MSSGGGSRVSNGSGGAARTSVNRDFNTPSTNRSLTNTTTNRNADRQQLQSADANRDVNRTVNRDVNRNVNVNGNYDLDYDVDNHWHPVARAAAFTAGAALTAAAIGSVVYSLPPSCTSTTVSGVTYQQCGSAWYQPQFAGTSVSYVVVSPPQ